VILETPTPYPDLNAVLQELVSTVQRALGSNFAAACLQGSFAVGDFDQHSDVDFIVALNNPLSDLEVDALQAMHARIDNLDCTWAQHLEGSYFPRDILRSCSRRDELLWYLDNGHRTLERSKHSNTVVVRQVVREYGVRLAGASPDALVDPIPVETLRHEIRTTITDWRQEVFAEPQHFNNWFNTLLDRTSGTNGSLRDEVFHLRPHGRIRIHLRMCPAKNNLVPRNGRQIDLLVLVREEEISEDFGLRRIFCPNGSFAPNEDALGLIEVGGCRNIGRNDGIVSSDAVHLHGQQDGDVHGL
jgi:predicted nucleotidyltransferase